MSALRCQKAHCGCALEELVLPGGATTQHCTWCARRAAGVCRECSLPVEGRVGWALRCATHKRERRRFVERRSDGDPELRRRRRARDRKRSKRPENRARKKVRSRAWRAANPDRVRQHKRRYLLKQSPTHMETQRRHNADPARQAKKRAHALKRYYELHPERPKPVCAACGVPIEYSGVGAPPKYHREHSPWKHQLKPRSAA